MAPGTPEPQITGDPTRRCIACKKPIHHEASICSECEQYQCRWKNDARYWAGIVGLIALVGSALFYMASNIPLAVDYFSPTKLTVADMNSHGTATFVNNSRQNVWIRYVMVTSEKPERSLRWEIDKIVAPDGIHVAEMIKLANERFNEGAGDEYGRSQGGYAADLPPEKADLVLRDRVEVIGKYVVAFLLNGGAEHTQVAELYKSAKLTTYPCTATVRYVYMSSNKDTTDDFPCLGVVKYMKPKPEGTASK